LDFSVQFVTHVGIAHTRWATHGEPNWVNTHPQRSDDSCGMYWPLSSIFSCKVNKPRAKTIIIERSSSSRYL